MSSDTNLLVLCASESDWRYYMHLGKDVFNKTKVIHKACHLMTALNALENVSVMLLDYNAEGVKGIINIINEINLTYPQIQVVTLANNSIDSYRALNTFIKNKSCKLAMKPISQERLLPIISSSLKEYHLNEALINQESIGYKNTFNKYFNGLRNLIHKNIDDEQTKKINNEFIKNNRR